MPLIFDWRWLSPWFSGGFTGGFLPRSCLSGYSCTSILTTDLLSGWFGWGIHVRVIPDSYSLPESNHDGDEDTANLSNNRGSISGATLAFGGILSGQRLWLEEKPRASSTCSTTQQPPCFSPKNTYVNRLPPRWHQRSIAGAEVTRLIFDETGDSSRRLPHFSRHHG
jgi:hypothetical protein